MYDAAVSKIANDTLSIVVAINPNCPAIATTAMTMASVTPIDRRDPAYQPAGKDPGYQCVESNKCRVDRQQYSTGPMP